MKWKFVRLRTSYLFIKKVRLDGIGGHQMLTCKDWFGQLRVKASLVSLRWMCRRKHNITDKHNMHSISPTWICKSQEAADPTTSHDVDGTSG